MVRWPGTIQPHTTSDAVVGAIDLYPTILDALKLKRPKGHIIDGVSFLPVLRQAGKLQRDAYFTWFPHLIPAVSVRQGDWKLVRRFEPHPQYPEVRELYNLKQDIGETRNLARKMPEKVRQLDTLIDAFINRSGALAPKPNPAYKPRDATWGLVPRNCKLLLVAGALRVKADGRVPFLGTAQVRHAGPLTLKLRARSTAGGKGRVTWKTGVQKAFPRQGQSVEFTLPAGSDWQDVTVKLPIQGNPAIIRLYLPVAKSHLEIESIQYFSVNSKKPVRVWDFTSGK